MNRFSETTFKLLKEAGWFPGRDVWSKLRLPQEFELFPAAREILREFGQLRVGKQGPGIERARSTIVFEPEIATGANDWFSHDAELLQTRLYPLGEVDDQNMFLAIDEQGSVFLISDDLMFVDNDFNRALDKMLMGIKLQLIDDEGNLAGYIP